MNNAAQNPQHDPPLHPRTMEPPSLTSPQHISPIRKDLIKNLCKYYVLLKETELLDAHDKKN
jgi:hypothetical protein